MPSRNPLRDALEDGEVAFGATATTHDPALVDVYGELGLEYVWFDFEHIGRGSTDATALAELRRAATAAGIEPMVRVESPEPHVVRKVLDAGVRSIVLPRVETAAEVRRAVEASRFVYGGEPGDRGVGVSPASDWGGAPDDYARREDESVLVGAMIENATAAGNVGEIADVPGLGFGWIGPTDLSVSLGHPLKRDHPDVRDAIDRARRAFRDAGVPVGISAAYAGGVEAGLEDGYRLLKLGSEVGAARTLIGERLERGRDALGDG